MRYKILCFCEDMISLHSQRIKKKKKSFSLIESGKKKQEIEEFVSLKCVVEKDLPFFCFVILSTAIDWLLQTHLTSCRDDWQTVVHVIANQVTDALEAVVFGAHHSLWIHQKQVFRLTALLSSEDVLAWCGV